MYRLPFAVEMLPYKFEWQHSDWNMAPYGTSFDFVEVALTPDNWFDCLVYIHGWGLYEFSIYLFGKSIKVQSLLRDTRNYLLAQSN